MTSPRAAPTGIDGLEWLDTHTLENGRESVVVPFPTSDLVHIVFHGEQPFSHGHYGFHLGLEDRLTFLGSREKTATGHFVDCRRDSPTFHRKVDLTFHPSVSRTLRIPCGVGHCFDDLDGVFTLNTFRAYLPPPDVLMTDKNPWATGADILNFPLDSADEELPIADPNPYPASPRFYELLSRMQSETLGSVDHEYPFTEEVTLPDGTVSTLMIRKRLTHQQRVPEWEQIDGIHGLGWSRHLAVWSGDDAGYVALTDPAPVQVIDHGTSPYATDAYGIHLEWEDRLTFLGPLDQSVEMRFIDCRRDSPTYHAEVVYTFKPSPLRAMVIPAGVAHAPAGMENVFTVNRPRRCAGDPTVFEPGNDVIDWPLSKRPAPTFEISPADFEFAFYRTLADRQRRYLANAPAVSSTPATMFVSDDDGRTVKVALRKIHADGGGSELLQR